MKPGDRAALFLMPDEPDQVPRLERFRAAHPEVIILLRGPMPKAWVGGRKIVRHTLRDLLDDLEETFPPDAGGGLAQATRQASREPPSLGTPPRPAVLAAPGSARLVSVPRPERMSETLGVSE